MKQCRACVFKSMPGWVSCEHLNDSAAKAPDIGLTSMSCLHDDLGGHPVRGAAERGWAVRAHVTNRSSSSKVAHLARAIFVHEDVGALDIAVHDAVSVQVLDAGEYLCRVDARHAFAESSEPLEQLGDATSGDVLQKYVEAVRLPARANVPHNVRMVEVP